MKNLFVILVTYTQKIEVIDEILPSHREYLKKGYESGNLLASGPQDPRVGGIIIGCFADKKEAKAFTQNDPFCLKNAASYEILEFNPVLHHQSLKEFLNTLNEA
ncbi:YciI family protein [Helicobacter mesocricetorum]|uniref:YciI family protein n=1 Tax=Helicobacter mesocricetorum TaxID=87012 RepID=UPI000CF0F205|nr:YciI family protein [Helicobacter mesocricetorum]